MCIICFIPVLKGAACSMADVFFLDTYPIQTKISWAVCLMCMISNPPMTCVWFEPKSGICVHSCPELCMTCCVADAISQHLSFYSTPKYMWFTLHQNTLWVNPKSSQSLLNLSCPLSVFGSIQLSFVWSEYAGPTCILNNVSMLLLHCLLCGLFGDIWFPPSR